MGDPRRIGLDKANAHLGEEMKRQDGGTLEPGEERGIALRSKRPTMT